MNSQIHPLNVIASCHKNNRRLSVGLTISRSKNCCFVVYVLLPILITQQLRGVNYNWDGGGGNQYWDVSANWSPDGNPNSADAFFITDADVVVRDARQVYRGNVNTSTASDAASLTIGSGASLSMPNGLRTNWRGGASVGDATVTVSNGGVLEAGFFDTNQGSGSTSSVEILSGGNATFGSFTMNDAAGTGNVVVDGSGSVMTVTGNTIIADTAGGNLTLSNGGTLNVGGSFDYNSNNALVIGGSGSRFALGTGGAGGEITQLNNITINSGGTFAINQSDAVTQGTEFSSTISGAGSIEQCGSGTTTLNASNSHSGGTKLTAGTLVLGNAGAAGTGALTLSGGMLQSLFTHTNAISVTGVSNTAVIAVGGTLTLSGDISGSGTLSFGGNGSGQTHNMVRLSGDASAFTGTIIHDNDGGNYLDAFGIGGGNLKLNTIGDTGSATPGWSGVSDGMRIVDGLTVVELSGSGGRITGWNTSLTVNQSTDSTYSGRLADAGSTRSLSLLKEGSGTLALDYVNSYTGTTTIEGGTLAIGAGGTTGSLSTSSAITNNGALVFNRSNAVAQGTDFANGISGTGSLTQNGSGTLTLSSANTYSGGTILNAGTLVIGNTAAAGTGTITQSSGSSLLKFDTTGTVANDLSIFNVATNQTVTLSGAITAQNTTYDVASGTTLSLNGTISGSGGITKNGTGTLVVEGNNSYTGNTTVNDGILQANAANALGNSTVTVNGGSLLVTASNAINDSKGVTLAGGTLAYNGTVTDSIGALTLSADSIIDLGTGSVSASFADLAMGLYNLSIYNWTGTTLSAGGDGNNTDKIYFNTSLSSSELQRISFYSDFGSSFVGTGFQFGAGFYQYEVIPVPEPEAWASAALLLIGVGVWMWRGGCHPNVKSTSKMRYPLR